MGRLEDIVNADSLEALMALREESGVDAVLEEKATPIQRAVSAARERERAEHASSGSSDDERDYDRDPIGRFAHTSDGGRDRDGDGDSDPALGKAGYAKIGTLADVGRQIAGWLDNVPPEKRREQRFRLLARASELGASTEVLQKIRALPAPAEKKDDDVSTMETKTPASAVPAGLEHKAAPTSAGVQVLETDDETGLVTALVSVTGVVDNVKDQIEPGAYTKTMAKREPIGVWSHDDKTWVARTEEAVELHPGDPFLKSLTTMDGQPWDPAAGAVKVTARFNLETPHGKAAYSDVKFFQGKTGWSIGYRATKAFRNPKTGVRHIKELDWYEYSPVMVGAASQPMTLSVKSASALHAVDPDDDTGLASEEMLEELTLDELDRLDALKASLGLEVKARVRTPEGSRRYGQPIGSVIIPDAVSSSVGAKELTSGMEVSFQGMGPGGPSDPKPVAGKITKVNRDGNITTVTVNGEDHKLIGNSPVTLTGGKGGDAAHAALSDKDLVTMLQEAEDDDERKIIRAAAALPPGKRRAFLTSGGKDGGAQDTPAAAKVGDQVKVGGKFAEVTAVNGDELSVVDHVTGKRSTVPAADAEPAPDSPYGGPNVEVDGKPHLRSEKLPDGSGRTYGDVADERAKKPGKPDDQPAGLAGRMRAHEGDAEAGNDAAAADAAAADAAPSAGGRDFPAEQAAIKDRKAKAGEKEADEIRSRFQTSPDFSGMTDAELDAERARLEPKTRAGQSNDKADMDLMRDVLREKRARAAEKEAGSTRTYGGKGGGGDKPAPAAAGANMKAGQPANDKGENVSDFVNAVISDVRDEEYRQMESELQHVLDRYEADPKSRYAAASLKAVLSAISEDGINGENIDNALELLDMAAYGGDGKPKPGKKDADLDDFEAKGSRASLDRSPKKNWVENAGELPGYFREVARAIEREQGLPLDRAIPIAIGRIKKWARGGGGVKADTVAKAAAAVAQWEALKAKNAAKYDSELLEHIEHKALVRMDLIDQLESDGLYSVELKALVDDNEALADDLGELAGVVESKADVGMDDELLDLLARAAEVKGFGAAVVEDEPEDFAALLARRAQLG